VSSSAPAPYVACRFPHGGLCLGTLGAGRHRSREFRPGLAYTVPRGWQNVEDLDANLELLPPNVPLPAVDAGRADFIGCTAT
jgi:hypothetical protein